MTPVEVLSFPEAELAKSQRYYVASEASKASGYLLPADEEERER